MKQVAWQLNWFLLHFPNCWQQLLVLGENRGSCSFSIAIIAGWQRLQPSISGRLIIIGLFDKNAAWRAALIKRTGFAGGGEKGRTVDTWQLQNIAPANNLKPGPQHLHPD